MTDKVQKILSEIATRKLCTMDEHMAFYNDNAKEDYRLLSEIEELIKALQEEPASEDLEEAAEMFIDSLIPTEVDTVTPFAAEYVIGLLNKAIEFGANWQKQQMIKQSLEAVRKEFPDGTFTYSTKNLIDDDMEKRGFCLFDYLNVRIVLIQSV